MPIIWTPYCFLGFFRFFFAPSPKVDIAKVRLSYCFTVWLALGSPGWLFSCLSPCQKYLINPYNAIFFKSQGSKDIKNDILDCHIHKYTNTSIQIHKYTNTAYEKGSEILYISGSGSDTVAVCNGVRAGLGESRCWRHDSGRHLSSTFVFNFVFSLLSPLILCCHL